MKKLLIGLSIATLSNMSLASERTGFYLKATVGANKMNQAREKNSIEGISINSNKSETDISPAFNIGAGGYINDFIRHDLTFGYSKINFKESTVNFNVFDRIEDLSYIGQVTAKRKSSIYSLIFNSYIDLPITDNLKFFLGGGIGLAQIKEKLSQTFSINAFEENTFIGSHIENNSSKTKDKFNLAYSLTLGTSIKISPKANIELAYSWRDFGSTNYNKDSDGNRPDKNRYNGHSVMTGIRFDL